MPILPLDCHLPTQYTTHTITLQQWTNNNTNKSYKQLIYIYICHVNVTQTVPDISPLMPMHQDPLLVDHVVCRPLPCGPVWLVIDWLFPWSSAVNTNFLWVRPQTWYRTRLSSVLKLFIHENAFENIVCEMAAILSRGRWVKRVIALNRLCFTFYPLPFRPKGYCCCLRLSVRPSVPLSLRPSVNFTLSAR